MLYVDFFWTWGIGAMFAVAASRQLKEEKEMWVNKYFLQLVLFMAIDFGATGMVLLWTNPAWETMQVFWVLGDIPLWFVLLWLVSNVVLPIIAYWWTFKFIKQGKAHDGMILSLAGYMLFFFVLFYGWDGTGYQRFFYDATGTVISPHWNNRVPWEKGAVLSFPPMGLTWFYSNIAVTLYILGIFFLIPHFYICIHWATTGMRNDPALKEKLPKKGMKLPMSIVIGALLVVVAGLLMALAAGLIGWLFMLIGGESLSILGIIVGIPVVIVVCYFTLLKHGKLFHKLFNKFFYMSESAKSEEIKTK